MRLSILKRDDSVTISKEIGIVTIVSGRSRKMLTTKDFVKQSHFNTLLPLLHSDS